MTIKLLQSTAAPFDPRNYILHDALRNAAEVAISLRQPLLLMGEPGTGKTRFAEKLALDLAGQNEQSGLDFADRPLEFYTKTAAQSRDLFYNYDALAHFQSANVRREFGQPAPPVADFVKLEALGKAIAMTDPAAVEHPRLREGLGDRPRSTVVLVDEIDKAPRDFPNDILNEVERQQFSIPEIDNLTVRRNPAREIVLVLTSNSEKNLPDAFLRRCVFYHIPFPEPEQLFEIAKQQLGAANRFTDDFLKKLIERFVEARRRSLRKAPATAEMLAWLRVLGLQEINDLESAENQRRLRENLSILVKTKEDLEAMRGLF